MDFLIPLFLLAILLFVLAFVTNRRFGILGLALFAGSYLAHSWTGVALPFVQQTGVDFSQFGVSTDVLIGIILTIVPSIILLVNSPKYSGKWARVVGALAYAVLSCILLVPVLKNAFTLASAQSIVAFITTNYTVLVTAGLIASIGDLFLSKVRKPSKEKHSKHGRH